MSDFLDPAAGEDPPEIRPGDVLSLEDPLRGTSVSATVVETAPDVIGLRLPPDAPWRAGRIGLRRFGADGRAWYGETMCRPGEGEADVVAGAPGMWEADSVRRSARVEANRAPVTCETYPPNAVTRDLVAVDVSGTGMRATGSGAPLGIGTPVRISLDGPWQRRWVHAVVVWSAPAAYGHYSVGLRFGPQTRTEQELILVWRDQAARHVADP